MMTLECMEATSRDSFSVWLCQNGDFLVQKEDLTYDVRKENGRTKEIKATSYICFSVCTLQCFWFLVQCRGNILAYLINACTLFLGGGCPLLPVNVDDECYFKIGER